MTVIADIFSNDAFSATSLTAAINIVPNAYGRLNELGLFENEPIPTTTVGVQFENGTLNLLPTRERGAPSSLGMPDQRNAKVFSAFHIPHDDFVKADDVQNILARVGQDGALEGVQTVVNRKQINMRRKHAITLEHMRISALRGEILDSDGSSLLNLFTSFGVTQKSIDFLLGTADTNVGGKIDELSGYMEDNLNGEVMSNAHVLCSPEWFAKLTSHKNVKEAWAHYDGTFNVLRQDVRKKFVHRGVTFEEYRGTANYLQENGTYGSRRFIPAGEAIAFPMGTIDTFRTYWAPADFIDTVNTLGEQIYVRQAVDPEFQRWVKIHSQSNPLPMVKRPGLLVRLISGN
ncbi:major capsid protein [Terrihabitans rhizophilus]|uniref:Major capsid protein n=1 Tax=Terrihabitans rhizophilus TaxID=3092662 RepID=A0ABU4RRL9_9HYPH|nr:major capsid protein [Terrihabitans sp. PJ23]MDX6806320.1 major capsid protein [Terrihabitans sp. PJ23]